jgi:hypothetical protein
MLKPGLGLLELGKTGSRVLGILQSGKGDPGALAQLSHGGTGFTEATAAGLDAPA